MILQEKLENGQKQKKTKGHLQNINHCLHLGCTSYRLFILPIFFISVIMCL